MIEPDKKPRVLILGAGFGGLELSSALSEEMGDDLAVTLIDKSDSFVFGFSELDVMFGRSTEAAVRVPYAGIIKPGVRFTRETITAIDPAARRVTTNAGTHEADILVIALGADYDVSKTPGVTIGENEFYSVEGAARLRETLPSFTSGHAVVGVCGAPYKCPPAPSVCALMLHEYLEQRGVRNDCHITIVIPFPSPVPPSPDTSRALVEAFAERDIEFLPNRRVASVDAARKTVALDDGRELPCGLFLGVPQHCAPEVVVATGMTEKGWVTVEPRTLRTSYPGVYALGDVSNTGAAKAGVFAEGAARTVADNLVAHFRQKEQSAVYPGTGSCYIEFGGNKTGRVDVDFFSGPTPTGKFHEPSEAQRMHKRESAEARRERWFGH